MATKAYFKHHLKVVEVLECIYGCSFLCRLMEENANLDHF